MKLTEKTKRRLTVAGLGVVGIALVIAIASQFNTEVPNEPEILPTQAVSSEVTPSADIPDPSTLPSETPKISVPSIDPTETPAVTEGADTGNPLVPSRASRQSLRSHLLLQKHLNQSRKLPKKNNLPLIQASLLRIRRRAR